MALHRQQRRRRSFTWSLFLIASFLIIARCSARESHDHDHGEGCGCPKHRAQLQQEFIPDPNDDKPPDVHEGIPRYVADPNSVKPDYWDDEDDGPWEADLIENPDYGWKPRMITNPHYVSPPGYLSKLAAEVQEALPWVTLGVILVAVMGVIPLPLDTLRSQLCESGRFAVCKAALIGLATPLCSCGSLPIAAGFVEAGIPLSSVVAFLTASQSAGLDSAAITYGLLGPMAAACRLLGALILAISAGTALRSSGDKAVRSSKSCLSTSNGTDETNGTSALPSDGRLGLFNKLFTELIDTATEIFPLVVAGLAVSTAAVHFVPMLTTPFEAMNGHDMIGKFLLRLGVLASALPLQLCEHTTAALAAGIQKAGGSAGLAFAFLLSAPATNLPSLLLLTRTAGTQQRRLAGLKVACALSGTALILSYAIDFAGIDLLVLKEAESDTGEMVGLPSEFVAASPWISGTLVTTGIMQYIKRRLSKERDDCSCPSSSCDSKDERRKKNN
mmetsp:Transcript_16324/g.32829  ORF Transcript_16324/g.32829 Transcript_16324/m.32829 type:complete len:502 (+) Transcript_16324:23-1528(+)